MSRSTAYRLGHQLATGLYEGEIIVDNFAGGGGASMGIEDALGRCKTAQVRMCGNSVCPGVCAALVRANCGDIRREVAA